MVEIEQMNKESRDMKRSENSIKDSTQKDDLQKVLKGEKLGNILQDWAKKE